MAIALTRERLEELAEPILVMEARRFRRRGFRLVTAISALLLVMLPVLVLLWRWDGNVARIVLLVASGGYLFLSIVMIPAYGGRSISRERETGTWDTLSMTLLRSSRIADQKVVAAALPVLVIWAAGLPLATALAFYGGASVLEFVALEAALICNALAVSAWSVQASNECGSSAQAVAYLPASAYVCGCAAPVAYLLVAVILLFMPALRAQAGRLFVGGLLVQVASGASQYFVWMLGSETVERMIGGPTSSTFSYVPAWAIALIALVVTALATYAMRHVLAWSIERRRTE